MAEKKTVIVDLLGQKLPIRTDQSPEDVQRVARTLAERFESIRAGAGAIDTLRLALLAALDLNRELLATRRELEHFREEATERTLALVEQLEAGTTLHETPPDLFSKPMPRSEKKSSESTSDDGTETDAEQSGSTGGKKPPVLV